MNRRKSQLALLTSCLLALGCHDGPLYALKTVNPYFINQWKEEEKWGTSEVTRRKAIDQLVAAMPGLSEADQAQWQDDVRNLLETDESPHNRFLAVQAAKAMKGETGLQLLELALKDSSTKVRIGTCSALADRPEPRAGELLASAAGTDTNSDVRLAALRAMGNHRGEQISTALRGALQSDDPAYQLAAMNSLRQATGTDQGNSADAWVAYLDQNPQLDRKSKGISDRLKDLF